VLKGFFPIFGSVFTFGLLAAILKAAQKENPSQPLTQAVWKKKKKKLATNKITKQNRQEIKTYE